MFTISGTYEVSNYRLFYDGQTGQWLSLKQMSDTQLDQVWYAAGENRDGITRRGAMLIFSQPVPNIPGGFLLFEMSEAGVRDMLPSIPEGGQLTITHGGKWLYPFQTGEELRQPEAGLRKTDDGYWEDAAYSPDLGLTYGYRCQVGDLGSKDRATLQAYMLIIGLIGLL